jgi:hypothetical protein
MVFVLKVHFEVMLWSDLNLKIFRNEVVEILFADRSTYVHVCVCVYIYNGQDM